MEIGMKRKISVVMLLLLSACGFVNPSHPTDLSPLEESTAKYSLDLPEEWTKSPTEQSPANGTPTANETTAFPKMEYTPTETGILEPTSTPFEPQFDVAADTLLTMAYGYEINAVNWNGEISAIMILDNINDIHMEISPNRKILAISGTGEDGVPRMTIVGLENLQIIAEELFSGTIIVDFTWSPDSQNLLVSELTYRAYNDFDTTLYRMAMDGNSGRIKIIELKGTVVYQTEWGSDDQIAGVEFTCHNAVEVDTGYGDRVKIGQTILGIVDLRTNQHLSINVSDRAEYGTSEMVLSPDGAKILYSGFKDLLETGIRPDNQLFSMEDLAEIPCPFCLGWSDAIWTSQFLLVQSGVVGHPGGAMYLINESGDLRKLMEYENIGPHSRIYQSNAATYWIDYQPQYVGNPGIVVTDIQACIPEEADMTTCQKDLWNIRGESPDGYNDVPWNLDIRCG
jgi:hypothetical protein